MFSLVVLCRFFSSACSTLLWEEVACLHDLVATRTEPLRRDRNLNHLVAMCLPFLSWYLPLAKYVFYISDRATQLVWAVRWGERKVPRVRLINRSVLKRLLAHSLAASPSPRPRLAVVLCQFRYTLLHSTCMHPRSHHPSTSYVGWFVNWEDWGIP